jgi:hypothetical protein
MQHLYTCLNSAKNCNEGFYFEIYADTLCYAVHVTLWH